MRTVFLFIFPDPVIRMISTWLLYSLGAGLLLALLTGLTVLLTRGSAATKRYNLLLAALSSFAIVMLVLLGFGIYPMLGRDSDLLLTMSAPAVVKGISSPAPVENTGIFRQILHQFELYAFPIVMAWMLLAGIRTVRLLAGVHAIRQMKTRRVEPAPARWQQKLETLAAQLGMKARVRLLYSYATRVPMVIGHFKPVVLLPFSLAMSLPAPQVEAILLHELAHIARRDYLVNLFVSLLETLFFFNPAVVWTAALLRKERENCCDDMAVALLDNPKDYIEALVSCQQMQEESPVFATALFNRPGQLLGRVKRMIYKNGNQSLNNMEKSILSISLVAGGMLVLAFTGPVPAEPKSTFMVYNKCPENADIFRSDYWQKSYGVKDTMPAPPPPPPAPAAPGNTAGPVPPPPDAPPVMNGSAGPVPPPPDAPPVMNGSAVPVPAVPKATPKAAPSAVPAPKAAPRAGSAQMPAAPDAPAAPNSTPAVPPVAPAISPNGHTLSPLAALDDKLQAPRPIRKGDPAPARPAAPGSPALPRSSASPVPPPDPEPQRQQILNEMKEDGIIIKIDAPLSFKLSSNEFIVNGVRQPQPVFEKYRGKYEKLYRQSPVYKKEYEGSGQPQKKGEWSWYYNYDTNTTVQ